MSNVVIPSFSPIVITLAIGTIFGLAGQQILLPLFIATEQRDADPFFVLFFCSFIFNFVFWPLTAVGYYRGTITKSMFEYKGKWKVFMTGVFNALNGFMVVFTSSAVRVSPPLQAILVNTSIPFTIIMSKLILGKHYRNKQLLGAFFVFIGVFVALMPIFIDIATGHTNFGSSAWYFPVLLGLSAIPAVLTFIFEEWIFEEMPSYDIRLLLAIQSSVQFITICFCFFVDLIPGFGFASTTADFWRSFHNGFQCFFYSQAVENELSPKCKYASILGAAFGLAYCAAYGCGGLLCKYASANFTCVINSVTPCLVVAFWFAFPTLSNWAGAPKYTELDIAFNLGSLPLLVFGILLYRYYEEPKSESDPLLKTIEEERLFNLQDEPLENPSNDKEC
jgi:drug/metabolite transporter (DMT)-like permease